MWKKGSYNLLASLIILAIVASSVAVFSAADLEEGISEEGIAESGEDGIVSLAPPSFITVARASEDKVAFPEDEAGIAAYIFTNQTISIEKIKTIFSSVVEVGDNYIIGITPIPDYGGDITVHVYADIDGWLVAYLKMDEPAAKIMQWGTTDVNSPKIGAISSTLEDALIKAGEAAKLGINKNKIKYYDFEFPNANGMIIFVRTMPTWGSSIHQVEIPADYMLCEASYYYYIYYCSYYHNPYPSYPKLKTYWDSKLKVDGNVINDAPTSFGWNGKYEWWRTFESYRGAITTGMLHTIEIAYEKTHSCSVDVGSAGVATVLIFRSA